MVNPNAQGVLREIAKRMHASVRKCELYDANVGTFEPDPSNMLKVIILEGQPFVRRTSFINQGRRVRMFANEAFIKARMSHKFDVEPFSINRSNRNRFEAVAGELKAAGQSYQIFSRSGLLGSNQNSIVDTSLIPFVERLRPAPEESIHIYSGEMTTYLKHPSLDRTLRAIDLANSFLEDAEHVIPQMEETDFSDLPSQFHPLIPLIKAWGISDDGERDELRERTPKATLQRLVDEVKPYYGAINSYLDSLGDHPEPEAATALGALAEFAAETDLYLKKENN